MLATQDLQKAGKKKRNLGEVAMDHSVKMWDTNMNKSKSTCFEDQSGATTAQAESVFKKCAGGQPSDGQDRVLINLEGGKPGALVPSGDLAKP